MRPLTGIVVLMALACGLAPALVAAAPPSSAPLPSFDQLDADGNGRLAPDEVAGTVVERRFRAMDTNGDTRVTRREYLAAAGLTSEGPGTFERLDADGDGRLSADEASGIPALATRFGEGDADSDGSLDRAELSAFEAARGMNGMELPPLRRSPAGPPAGNPPR